MSLRSGRRARHRVAHAALASQESDNNVKMIVLDRLNELMSAENITSVTDALRNLSTLTNSFAKQDAAIQQTLAQLPGAIQEFQKTFDKLNRVADSLNLKFLPIKEALSRPAPKAPKGKGKG